jgi:endonuclease/exonuclease/phosphatase family metal-dependent hydrolase
MKCVTYNIQYGIGMDGKYDLVRIADAVRGADLIALQEVCRNHPENGGHDLVAGLRDLLPDYFLVFGSPVQLDLGSGIEGGRAVSRYFEFGNMILSKSPILSSRNLLLPRRRSYRHLDLQRSALEAMVATPLGPIRFYSVHLDHLRADERIEQIRFLLDRVTRYALEGGAITGATEHGFPEPPHPEAFVLMGDFNMVPGSPEYVAMTGRPDDDVGVPLNAVMPADAALHAGGAAALGPTWLDPDRPGDEARMRRLDYFFVQAGLVDHVGDVRVDVAATGSDHRPVWLELA